MTLSLLPAPHHLPYPPATALAGAKEWLEAAMEKAMKAETEGARVSELTAVSAPRLSTILSFNNLF